MRLAEHAARMGDGRSAYRLLVGSPEGKRPFRRSRNKWEDNIKNGLFKKLDGGLEWIDLAQDKDRWRVLVNAVMNLRVP